MQLTIWTSASGQTVSKVFAPALRSFRPNVPPHKFVALEGGLITPEKGEVVLVCGTKAVDELRKAGIVHKSRTLSSLREKPVLKPGGGAWLVTYDPAITGTEFDKQEVIEWDVQLAARFLRTGSVEPQLGSYKYVSNYDETIEYIEAQFAKTGKPVDVSLDLETMGLHPWYPDKDIVTCSFTAIPETAHVIYLGRFQKHPVELDRSGKLFDQIKWLLNSPKVKLKGANLKFDLIWIAVKWGIECTNFVFDTLLVGTLVNENRSNSLNLQAKVMTTMGGYDDVVNQTTDKSRMELVPPAKMLPYAGGDTDACLRVSHVLKNELTQDAQLTKFYITILHPAARAFEKIERRGVVVDKHKSELLADELRKTIADGQKKMLELLPGKLRTKHRDKIDDQLAAGKSPLTPSILKDFFFSPQGLNLKPKEVTEKTKEPSLAKSHLRQFSGDSYEAGLFLEAMTVTDRAAKTLSTFVEGFLKHLRPDGRFHPTYMLFRGELETDDDEEDSGTVTGRLSCKGPAFQILPKKTNWAKKIRACYPAPPGKVIISIDYSQGELKVVACVAPEKTMIQAYLQGLDLHAVTGAKLANVAIEEFLKWKENEDKSLAALYEKHRGNAKPANFGLLYGMQVDGFRAYAWANYGIKLSFEEGEKMRNAFFELYPGLLDYHEAQRQLVRASETVRSPLGRIRHLPMIRSYDREIKSKAERQAINSPIQSCLSDMMLWAIALIDAAYPNGEIEVVGMIHDALIAYVPADAVELWVGRAVEIMSNLPLHEVGWKPQLKFTVDAEAGPDLASLKKLKLAA